MRDLGEGLESLEGGRGGILRYYLYGAGWNLRVLQVQGVGECGFDGRMCVC